MRARTRRVALSRAAAEARRSLEKMEERAVRASLNLGVGAGGEAILSVLCECRERGVETAHVDCGLRERGAFAGSKRFMLEGATRDCSVGAV